MLIDMEAIRTAAKNNAATPCYPANAANAANGKRGEISNVSKVATGFANDCQATKISSVSRISNVSKVAGGSNATPHDPGMARLLALADHYCTAIQASPKARADWQADIANTPAELRGDLAQYLRAQLAALPKPSKPVVALAVAAVATAKLYPSSR